MPGKRVPSIRKSRRCAEPPAKFSPLKRLGAPRPLAAVSRDTGQVNLGDPAARWRRRRRRWAGSGWPWRDPPEQRPMVTARHDALAPAPGVVFQPARVQRQTVIGARHAVIAANQDIPGLIRNSGSVACHRRFLEPAVVATGHDEQQANLRAASAER